MAEPITDCFDAFLRNMVTAALTAIQNVLRTIITQLEIQLSLMDIQLIDLTVLKLIIDANTLAYNTLKASLTGFLDLLPVAEFRGCPQVVDFMQNGIQNPISDITANADQYIYKAQKAEAVIDDFNALKSVRQEYIAFLNLTVDEIDSIILERAGL